MPAARPDDIAVLTGVHYSVDDKPIFRGLDIAIGRGQVTAIMGPSGTGKTTLLRLITGQIQADSGSVIVDGKDVSSLSRDELYALRRRMGMLFQNGALLTDIDVFENVAFPLREHAKLPERLVSTLVLPWAW
jgi:phospholipid/cholesterol/gamma-HCH transport system ATP-binding protein